MKVKITYCNSWNYKPQAFRVKDEITKAYPNADVEVILGDGGNFIVDVDGKVIFSKKDMKEPRFPFENEIVDLIKKA